MVCVVLLAWRICNAIASRIQAIAAFNTRSATAAGFASINGRRDARVLADAVRPDPSCPQRLGRANAEFMQLREWYRMADEMKAQPTRLTLQVWNRLWRHFPQFLNLWFPLSSAVLRVL